MRHAVVVAVLCAVVAGGGDPSAQHKPYRTLNDTVVPPQFASREAWNARAAYIRELILSSAGLLPMPERSPLRANVFGDVTHPDYIVSKAYFESLPGFFVTGNLYRPVGDGPFPAILSPPGIGRMAVWKTRLSHRCPAGRSASRVTASSCSPTT